MTALLAEPLLDLGPTDPDRATNWHDLAACAQVDPEVFFPETGQPGGAAKAVCNTVCPVREQCLAYALGTDQRFGVWGGLSRRERRRLRKGAV